MATRDAPAVLVFPTMATVIRYRVEAVAAMRATDLPNWITAYKAMWDARVTAAADLLGDAKDHKDALVATRADIVAAETKAALEDITFPTPRLRVMDFLIRCIHQIP